MEFMSFLAPIAFVFAVSIMVPIFIIPVSSEITARVTEARQQDIFILMMFVSLLGGGNCQAFCLEWD